MIKSANAKPLFHSTYPAMEFAAAADAPVVSLDSKFGPQSFTCVSLGPTVARFLADPNSVRSETFRDPGDQ